MNVIRLNNCWSGTGSSDFYVYVIADVNRSEVSSFCTFYSVCSHFTHMYTFRCVSNYIQCHQSTHGIRNLKFLYAINCLLGGGKCLLMKNNS